MPFAGNRVLARVLFTIDTDKAIEALRYVGFKKEQARVLIDQLLPGNDQIVTKDLLQAEI